MGSKAKYAEDILRAIKEEIVGYEPISCLPYTQWVEPFVGGANMIDKVPKSFKRIGNDINIHLINMFQEIQKGWKPPDTISEKEYKQLMNKSDISFGCLESPLIGFVGIGCSYSGKWFGGYARGNDNNGNPRNYCLESKKNVLKQLNNIKDVIFINGNYFEMNILTPSIIYCDPPYKGTTKYKTNFDHDRFWEWCDEMIKRGHKVFVSEYNAPKDWRCIWEKSVNSSLTKETGSKKATERLFTK